LCFGTQTLGQLTIQSTHYSVQVLSFNDCTSSQILFPKNILHYSSITLWVKLPTLRFIPWWNPNLLAPSVLSFESRCQNISILMIRDI